MSELNPLFVKCALWELNQLGYTTAAFDEELAVILPNPDIPTVFMNDRVVKNFGTKISYSKQDIADMENVRGRCAEMVKVYQSAKSVEITRNRKDQLLLEFNDMILTGKEVEDGLSFCIWKSDLHAQWPAYDLQHETRDYPQAKLFFCQCSGILQPEQFDVRLSQSEMVAVSEDLIEGGVSYDPANPPNYVTAFDAIINTVNSAFTRRMGTLGDDTMLEQEHEMVSGPSEPSMG